MDPETERKWDRAASLYDLMSGLGPERRWGAWKRDVFSHMGPGKILFVAAGTGLEFRYFPLGRDIVAIDISAKMIEKARPRAEAYEGKLVLRQEDVHELSDPEASYDQIFTSCTFCSVPRPVEGLRQLFRVAKPGGELWMFEHTGSRLVPFGWMLDLMTPFSSRAGPDLNRATVENVARAGFEIRSVQNHFLDVVKTIQAKKGGLSPFSQTSGE